MPRLRSAMFFRDKPGVDYRLPHIVGCDTPETEAMLRAEGFGTAFVPWQVQFRHRFIISMDGNGATCSRVAITLRSRSVLLKYASRSRLYDFAELEPWTPYVPIAEDADVLRVLSLAAVHPAAFRALSRRWPAVRPPVSAAAGCLTAASAMCAAERATKKARSYSFVDNAGHQ